MKRLLAFALIGLFVATFATDADAQRRLGGGRSIGKQSQPVQERQATPPQQAPAQQNPAQQATPSQQSAAAAPAPRPASPWKGALLGLAAGLGLAALAAHFGLSETFTAFLMAALIGLAVLALAGFVMRRMRGGSPQPAYGGAGGPFRGDSAPRPAPSLPTQTERIGAGMSASARPGSAMDEFSHGGPVADTSKPWGVPAGFDTAAFLARAKDYFVKLQGAWDRGDLTSLEEFTTHDMFVALTHELRARGGGTRTEVVTLDATLLGIESTAAEHLASVRFSGSLRVDGDIEQVDEVWNLSKPIDGSSGWLLAGVQQLS